MREILYHRNAARYLKRMPVERKEQIKSARADIAVLPDIRTHPNVKPMAGDWNTCHRLRIGQYRAIFLLVLKDEIEKLEVLQVGPRGGIY